MFVIKKFMNLHLYIVAIGLIACYVETFNNRVLFLTSQIKEITLTR